MPVHVLRPVGCPKKRPFFFAVRRKYPIFTKTMEKQPPCDAKAFSGEPFGHSSSATYSNSYTPCTTGRPTGQSISAGTSTFSMPGPPACYLADTKKRRMQRKRAQGKRAQRRRATQRPFSASSTASSGSSAFCMSNAPKTDPESNAYATIHGKSCNRPRTILKTTSSNVTGMATFMKA